MVMGPALPPREGDAQERAPRLGERPLARWSLLHGGEHRKGTGRGGLTKNPARLRGPKPGLGMHVLKPRGGHGRGSGWCHLPEGDLPRVPHPLKGGDPGTGPDQPEGVKEPGASMGEGARTDRRLRIREERRTHFSW